MADAQRLDCFSHCCRDDGTPFEFRIGKHGGKLFASISGHNVTRSSHGSIQHLCHGFDAIVTGGVPKAVVVRLEVIDINHN